MEPRHRARTLRTSCAARWSRARCRRGRATGIWHLAGPEADCARGEWARRLVVAFERASVRRHPRFAIDEIPTAELKQRAPRPLHGSLLTTKADALGFQAADFDKTIAEI